MRRVQEGEGAQRRTPGDQTLLRKSRSELCSVIYWARRTIAFWDLLLSFIYCNLVIYCGLRHDSQTCMKICCVL